MSATTPAPQDRLGLWALAASTAISYFGNMLTFLAVPWFVLVTTGSASRTGLAGAVLVLAPVAAGVVSGPIIDRLGFKRASMIADLASGLTIAIIPALYMLDMLAFWHVLALTFLSGVLDVPGYTARQALLPGLARQAGVSLERGNSILHLSYTLSGNLIGAALGGLLIGFVGAAQVLYIDALTFLISFLIIGLAVKPERGADRTEQQSDAGESEGGYLDQLRAGVRLVRGDVVLMTIIPMATLINFVGSGFSAVVLPVYARESFDSASVYGLLVAATGAGSVLGSLAYGIWGERLPRYQLMLALFCLTTTGYWVFALVGFLPTDFLARFGVGLANGPISTMAMVLVQTRVPERMLGRVMGLLVTLASAAGPLGVLLAGVAIDVLGLSATLVIVAALMSLIPLWLALNPRARAAASEFERGALAEATPAQ